MIQERILHGKHVLITRGGEQGEKFCCDIASAGGVPHMVPLIDFRAHEDLNAPLFIRSLAQYDWIIFTSKNGVKYFFSHLEGHSEQFAQIKSKVRFAAVGEKTRDELLQHSIESHFMPHIYTAEDFSKEFFAKGLRADRVLIPKGNLASTTIADSFRARQKIADEWIVYDTFYPTRDRERLVQLIEEEQLDICAFTSPSTFHHFEQVVSQHHLGIHVRKLTFAAIGTVTKRAIEKAGYKVDICPDTFTIDSMFAAICDYAAEERNDQ